MAAKPNLSQFFKMLTLMEAQASDILLIEITVTTATVEMLQHWIYWVHIQQVIRLWKAILIPTILTAAANRPLVARV